MTKSNETEPTNPKDTAKPGENSPGFNLANFFRETKEELDKVVWPDRQRLIGESAAVILMVALSATIISLVDQLFSWAATQIF